MALREIAQPNARLAYLRNRGYARTDLPKRVVLDGIENGIGALPVPLGIATNFIVNDAPCLVTMATEERTVIAAASFAAKLCRPTGGFRVTVGPNLVAGQVLFSGFEDELRASRACIAILQRSTVFLEAMRRENPLGKYGCDVNATNAAVLPHADRGSMVALTFEMDAGESMGANGAIRVGEHLARMARDVVGRDPTAVICTNAAHGPQVTVTARWPGNVLTAARIGHILDLQAWAEIDDRRAVTHNKGVMNGVTAVCLATGQDVRAVEAAAHHAASTSPTGAPSRYMPLTRYRRVDDDIEGTLQLTIPLGTVGSAARQPATAWCRALMGANDVKRLAAICGAVGLAQNFAALRSLTGAGILAAHQLMAYDANH